MNFIVQMDEAKEIYTDYEFIEPLTPSVQKAAFHVIDRRSGRELCLKIIAPNTGPVEIQRELVALLNLNHPNIVSLVRYEFSIDRESTRHFFLEDFIAGSDLKAQIKPNYPWDLDRARNVFTQLFEGIHAVGKINVFHRDLKPSNIRIKPDDTPVIIDFGLARHKYILDRTSTSEGAQFGTPKYFSPEQIMGNKHHIDHRTDLFALGVILYETIVGFHPFYSDGMDEDELFDAICNSQEHLDKPEFNRLPLNWRVILQKLLSKSRAGRPLNGEQIALILQRAGD